MMSGKSALYGHFFVKFFQITCVHICIYLNTNENTPILHTCLTLSSLYCWLFNDSALVLGVASEKDKNNRVKLISQEVKLI